MWFPGSQKSSSSSSLKSLTLIFLCKIEMISWNSNQISYNSHQVWTLVQSCLILFSLTLGIVVAASRSNFTFLRCIGREEAFGWSDTKNCSCLFFRHNFSNFYKPDKFHGTEFLGPIWAPMRLLPNIPVFLFLLVVPALYGNIYIFRKKHSTTTIGWY